MKKIVMMVILVGLVGSPAFAGLIDGLEGYWPFEDAAQPGTDESGNGRDGVPAAGAVRDPAGHIGAAMDLHGPPEELAPSGPDLAISNAFTVAAWIKHDNNNNATERYVCLAPEIGVLRRHWQSRVAHFYVKTDGGFSDIFGPTLNAGTWYHMAGTWNGATGEQTLYVNGSPYSATPGGTLEPITDNTHIGWYGGESLDGLIDEVAVWNRALAPDEIEALYNNGDGTDLLPLLNLIPEPGSFAVLALGLAGLARKRRK